MIEKIRNNVHLGRYVREIPMRSARAYENRDGGWTDYLLAEQMIFSHRTGDYSPDNFPEDLHAHDYYELCFCAGGGNMQYVADQHHIAVRPGMVILTKPMAVHMFRALSSDRYDRYVLYFRPSLQLFSDGSILDFLHKGSETCAVFSPEAPVFPSHLSEAERCLADVDSPYAASGALLRILELFLALSAGEPVRAEDANQDTPDFIQEIKRYVDENFVRIRSVGELSEHFYYSREHITRLFRQCYNTPLYDYILHRKVLLCCSLLRQGESVDKAASLSGFNNMSSFIKVFRRFSGCTPSEYKLKSAKVKQNIGCE